MINQVRVTHSGDHPVRRSICFGLIRWTGYVYMENDSDRGDLVPDDVDARRTYEVRCGLIKAIHAATGQYSTITLYLAGFENSSIDVNRTRFEFDPELDLPTATLIFSSYGKRNDIGRRIHQHTTLKFRDKEQMGQYVSVIASAEPERVGRRSFDSPSRDDGCIF